MADVRTLLAAERSSRRLNHPHLSYTKSGLLQCSACNLNIRSESLWEGHLKSANHKKNTALAAAPVSKKRKIEDDEDEGTPRRKDETRKKSRSVRFKDPPAEETADQDGVVVEPLLDHDAEVEYAETRMEAESRPLVLQQSAAQPSATSKQPVEPRTAGSDAPVDEDEWAAFERDLAPLTRDPLPATASKTPNSGYTSAVITAPALSAAEIAAQNQQAQPSTRHDREAEAQDEKEESEARMQDEFAVMEEMEERVRRLREKREALRASAGRTGSEEGAGGVVDTGLDEQEEQEDVVEPTNQNRQEEEEEESEDDDETDDWFS